MSSSVQIRIAVFGHFQDVCNDQKARYTIKTKSMGSEVQNRLHVTRYNGQAVKQSDRNRLRFLKFERRENYREGELSRKGLRKMIFFQFSQWKT